MCALIKGAFLTVILALTTVNCTVLSAIDLKLLRNRAYPKVGKVLLTYTWTEGNYQVSWVTPMGNSKVGRVIESTSSNDTNNKITNIFISDQNTEVSTMYFHSLAPATSPAKIFINGQYYYVDSLLDIKVLIKKSNGIVTENKCYFKIYRTETWLSMSKDQYYDALVALAHFSNAKAPVNTNMMLDIAVLRNKSFAKDIAGLRISQSILNRYNMFVLDNTSGSVTSLVDTGFDKRFTFWAASETESFMFMSYFELQTNMRSGNPSPVYVEIEGRSEGVHALMAITVGQDVMGGKFFVRYYGNRMWESISESEYYALVRKISGLSDASTPSEEDKDVASSQTEASEEVVKTKGETFFTPVVLASIAGGVLGVSLVSIPTVAFYAYKRLRA